MKKAFVIMASLIIMASLFGNFSFANAQEITDTGGKVRLELTGFTGWGTKDNDIGTTTTGETVTLSAGGGDGAGLTLGYGLSKSLEVDLSVGYQKSKFSEDVANANGDFKRNFILGTLKLNVPLFKSTQLKIGAGAGYYTSGKWDTDLTKVAGGSHTVIEYDNSIGGHLSGELEYFFSNTWSIIFGTKYYYVKYDAKSVKVNNVSLPVSYLKDEFKKIDGSGIDVLLGVALYF
jgi:hypothetical protein